MGFLQVTEGGVYYVSLLLHREALCSLSQNVRCLIFSFVDKFLSGDCSYCCSIRQAQGRKCILWDVALLSTGSGGTKRSLLSSGVRKGGVWMGVISAFE